MANRRFEMFEYRQILLHMRSGQSDRQLAKAGLIGRRKAGDLRAVAKEQGWLDPDRQLPDDEALGNGNGDVLQIITSHFQEE